MTFRRLLLSSVLFTTVLSGCFAPVVTTAALVARHGRTLSFLSSALIHATDATGSVDEAFTDLETTIRTRQLTPEHLTAMEHTRDVLRMQADSLGASLSGAEENADALFDMMERRAKENQTESLRERMEENVRTRRESFSDRSETAAAALDQLNASIQQYDDIVGFLQVQIITEDVDALLAEIDGVAADASRLDADLALAIQEGREVIQGMSPAGS